MFIRQIIGRIRGEKRKERVRTEVEELKKALLNDPEFREEILKELEYRTGRRDLLKAGVLGLLGLAAGSGVGVAAAGNETARETISDYTGVKIPKPCTAIVSQDGTGDYDVLRNEDASEVIQRAIDYAAKKGGGEVRIREGEYKITNTVFIRHFIKIAGSGHKTLLKLDNCVNKNIFETSQYAQMQVIIKDIKIDGNRKNNNRGSAIHCRLWDSVIQNVVIQNMPEHGIDLRNKGLNIPNNSTSRDDNKIIACSIRKCGGVGIYTSPVLKIIGCDLGHNDIYVCENAVRITSTNIYGATIWIENKESIAIIGNHISVDGAKVGVKVLAKNGYSCKDIQIIGNDFRGAAKTLIDIESYSGCTISNVIIQGNTFNARNNDIDRASEYGVRIRGSGVIENLLIKNNIFTGKFLNDIFVNNAKVSNNIIFSDNIIS